MRCVIPTSARVLGFSFLLAMCMVPVFGQTAQVLSQPANLTVNLGSSALFTVTATNVVSYQWQFQGADLPGASNSELTWDNVQTNQAGAYRVIVTGADSQSVTSQTATLTVIPGTLVRFALAGGGNCPGVEVNVTLFDHDKPVTVQNFLHYVVRGVYTNILIHRLEPGFVVQSGGYSTQNGSEDFMAWRPIREFWLENFVEDNPPFPWGIVNEYDFGPRISNKFGTIAMAKLPGGTNSATSGFFFNLGDNSGAPAYLDSQTGGFTVFGRVVSGEETLNYFNSLSKPANGITDMKSFYPDAAAADDFQNLPVRYNGTNYPRYDDLLHWDISLQTTPKLDSAVPAATITYPPDNARLTNGKFTFSGTASDNIGLARVVLASGGWWANAYGTTNWYYDFNLEPGSYFFYIVPQDGYGNRTFLTRRFIITTPITLLTNGPGSIALLTNGAQLEAGKSYDISAVPRTGAMFAHWSDGTRFWFTPKLRFQMSKGLTLTATFLSNTIPGAITFNSPAADARLTNNVVSLRGKIAKPGVSRVVCNFFSEPAGPQFGSEVQAVVSGTNWSADVDLAPGKYNVQATAYDEQGRSTLISRRFTVLALMRVQTVGLGTFRPNYNNQFLELGKTYAITSSPSAGQLFAHWSDGQTTIRTPNVSFTMYTNLVLTATFVSNYFPSLQGKYEGLFYPDQNVNAANSGSFSLKTTSAGAYSGRFSIAGTNYPVNGRFDYNGTSSFVLRNQNPISVFMQMDLTNGTQSISGGATNATGPWIANLKAYRAQPKLSTNTVPRIGKYVLNLPGDVSGTNGPVGDGFASLSIAATNGVVISGTLADNTSFSQSTAVSKDGKFPIYASFSGGRGLLMGWQEFSGATNCAGNLTWIKPAAATNAFYTNGFRQMIESTGAFYGTPTPGSRYTIRLAGGTLADPVTGVLTVNASRQFVVSSGGTVRGLKIALDGKGFLTGSFLHPITGKTVAFKGAFNGSLQAGSGFILDQNRNTGYFEVFPEN